MKRPGEEFTRFLYTHPSYSLPRQAIFRRLKALLSLHTGRELSQNVDDCGLVVVTAPSANGDKIKKKMRWHSIPVGGQFQNCIFYLLNLSNIQCNWLFRQRFDPFRLGSVLEHFRTLKCVEWINNCGFMSDYGKCHCVESSCCPLCIPNRISLYFSTFQSNWQFRSHCTILGKCLLFWLTSTFSGRRR